MVLQGYDSIPGGKEGPRGEVEVPYCSRTGSDQLPCEVAYGLHSGQSGLNEAQGER